MSLKKMSYAVPVLVLLLLVGCLVGGLSPVMGQSISEFEEKTWKFITKVLMLDVEKYDSSVRVLSPPIELDSPPMVDLTYTFRSAKSEVTVNFIFERGILTTCFFRLNAGKPIFAEEMPEDVLKRARLILDRYRVYFGAKHVETMLDVLSQVKMEGLGRVKASEFYPSYSPKHRDDVELKGLIKTVGNIKMIIVIEPNEHYPELNTTYIQFRYVENGIVFRRKGLSIIFAPHDWVFSDTWNLYRVGSADLRVSMEDAIRIAKEAIKNYTYEAADYEGKTVVVGGFKVLDKPLYVYLGTDYRGGDYYTLYPYWEVYLCLDTMYLGGVTGIIVLIWADTGEIARIHPTGGFAAPLIDGTDKSTNEINKDEIIIAIVALAIIAISLATIAIRKKRKLRNYLADDKHSS